jgi:hypothetical protein
LDNPGSGTGNTVLAIGLRRNAVNYSEHREIDATTLSARITASQNELRAAGFDVVVRGVGGSRRRRGGSAQL